MEENNRKVLSNHIQIMEHGFHPSDIGLMQETKTTTIVSQRAHSFRTSSIETGQKGDKVIQCMGPKFDFSIRYADFSHQAMSQ